MFLEIMQKKAPSQIEQSPKIWTVQIDGAFFIHLSYSIRSICKEKKRADLSL